MSSDFNDHKKINMKYYIVGGLQILSKSFFQTRVISPLSFENLTTLFNELVLVLNLHFLLEDKVVVGLSPA